MCTVVLDVEEAAGPAAPAVLALRDEFTDREFDLPGRWWPEQPDAVGGRDRLAGGTWCATDVRTATTALVLNRTERFTGTPSRGLLPLAALRAGGRWPDEVPVASMAAFTLVLAEPGGVRVWDWDAESLRMTPLAAGLHVLTPRGTDTDDPRTHRFAPQFAARRWRDVVGDCEPSADDSALVVRRAFGGRDYATVFGQSIIARPGLLQVSHSRTPWLRESWRSEEWTA